MCFFGTQSVDLSWSKACCKVCFLLEKRKREENREALERENICHLAWFGWSGCNLLTSSARNFPQGHSPAFSLFLPDTGTARAHELSHVGEHVLLYSAIQQWWETIELGQRQEGCAYKTSEANDFSVASACSDLRNIYQEMEEIYAQSWD